MPQRFVIYDPHHGGFAKTFTKLVPLVTDARVWKRKKAAVAEASLINVSRNVPPGMQPSKKYQDIPDAVVHELDEAGNTIAVICAPPQYATLFGTFEIEETT